jgi:hypothetical protein
MYAFVSKRAGDHAVFGWLLLRSRPPQMQQHQQEQQHEGAQVVGLGLGRGGERAVEESERADVLHTTAAWVV